MFDLTIIIILWVLVAKLMVQLNHHVQQLDLIIDQALCGYDLYLLTTSSSEPTRSNILECHTPPPRGIIAINVNSSSNMEEKSLISAKTTLCFFLLFFFLLGHLLR